MEVSSLNPDHAGPDYCGQHPCVLAEIQSFHQQASSADVMTMTVLLSIVAIIGFIGNLIVIMVCVKFPTGLPSAQHFILVIAICDFLVILIIIPFRITSYHVIIPEVACKCLEGMTYCSVLFSLLMLIAVAFDRFFAVCHPITFQKISHLAKTTSVILSIVCLGISWPAGLMAGHYVKVWDNSTNTSKVCYTGVCNEDGEDIRFFSESRIFLYTIFLVVLFCILLLTVIVLYTCVFCSIYKRFSRRKVHPNQVKDLTNRVSTISNNSPTRIGSIHPHSTSTGIKDNARPANGSVNCKTRIAHGKAAKVLLLVTICFIVAWVPFFLMKTHLLPNVVTLRLSFFASNIINPVIYSFSNRQFRENVKKLFRRYSAFSV